MVAVEANDERTNGVTTVRVVVTNTRSTPQTVRLRCRLEDAVWLPRRDGVVDPRWDGDVWEATIRPNRSRGVGFASPEPASEPLVELVSSERCTSDEPVRSSAAVLADLDSWCPTSEVLERDP